MVFNIVIKPIVFIDVEEAIIYYEKQQNGLGKKFYDHFLTTVENIHHDPLYYSFIKEPVRRCKLKAFPYKIFYSVTKDTIYIIGLSHIKRSNTFVKRRLKML